MDGGCFVLQAHKMGSKIHDINLEAMDVKTVSDSSERLVN